MVKKQIKISELVLRDAHQSLLATRMKTEHMLPIAERMDKVGFWSVEMWGGATFDSCIRFLNENPWDRVRDLKKLMPNTPFQMLLRGQNLVGYRHYADDLVDKFVDLASDAGIDVFRVFDALNDYRNIRQSINRVKKNGKHAQGTISYTVSPVHSVPLFVDKAKELEDMGCDTICIKDMAGLLSPWKAEELISTIKEKVKTPLHLHTHTTSGFALMSITKAIEAGVDIIDTTISSLSMGTSHSPTETIVAALKDTENDTGLDMDKLIEIGNYFADVRKEYSNFLSAFTGVDVNILKSQVPGGMVSNLESQLKQQNAIDRLPEVMQELPQCRKDMGYPPLVTPTSQIVGTQAVLNVLMGRYKIISKESQDLVKGKYGILPSSPDPDLQKQVCGDQPPITQRPADLLEPEWEKLKEEVKDKATDDEDVIIFALFPQIADNYLKKRGTPSEEIFKKEETLPAEQTQKPNELEPSNKFRVTVNGKSYDVMVDDMEGGNTPTTAVAPTPEPTSGGGVGDPITAPLAGSVWKVSCKEGQQINEGDVIVVIEAMKMETDVPTPKTGVVKSVDIKEGDKVVPGQTLITIG
ncbi:MAG TPA: sodium-extruding oxaloacetate decarboxylase subunit alpha [Nitrospinota bacterium]|nr:sodium-extruding oxaloacetate decarboxylase subunit alpha [Nitrospinota bacterium]|tara:strand:- start:85637 stop:87382 length:1746 start_codon:yes stop_codon:yes gene_type:complete